MRNKIIIKLLVPITLLVILFSSNVYAKNTSLITKSNVTKLTSSSLDKESALIQAQRYLKTTSFSRKGLLDQLTSKYGSGFSEENATYAIEYLESNHLVDWNEQAVLTAKSYIKHTSFSRNGLIDQLTSEYGSQFTQEQGVYAVSYLEKNRLVNWNEQAILSAQSYLKHTSFSRNGLIDQLTSEYGSQFTRDQGEYAVSYLEKNNLVDWNEQAVLSAPI